MRLNDECCGKRAPFKVKKELVALRRGFKRIGYKIQSINEAVEYSLKLGYSNIASFKTINQTYSCFL